MGLLWCWVMLLCLQDMILCLMVIWLPKFRQMVGLSHHKTIQNWNYSLINRKLECQHFHWISIFVVKKERKRKQWLNDTKIWILFFEYFFFLQNAIIFLQNDVFEWNHASEHWRMCECNHGMFVRVIFWFYNLYISFYF